MNYEPEYLWEIEFVPKNPENLCATVEFTGTRAAADKFAGEHHPDFNCEQIVFHRQRGPNRQPYFPAG
jgi:hypothetical protein